MAKNITTTMNFVKDNGNTAMATVFNDGKVDVTIDAPAVGVTAIRHFDNLTSMVDELNALGYAKI